MILSMRLVVVRKGESPKLLLVVLVRIEKEQIGEVWTIDLTDWASDLFECVGQCRKVATMRTVTERGLMEVSDNLEVVYVFDD